MHASLISNKMDSQNFGKNITTFPFKDIQVREVLSSVKGGCVFIAIPKNTGSFLIRVKFQG